MSKNQSRKGYVVGALVALVSTLFTVAPAQADANGPVTLLPTQGTTFNTIAGSPISLLSAQDPSTRNGEAASTSALKTFYVISNPDGDTYEVTYARNAATASSFVYLTYNATTGVATPVTNTNATGVSLSGASTNASTFKLTVSASKIAIPAFAGAANAESLVSISLNVPTTSDTVTLKVRTLVDYSTGDATTTGLFNATGFDRQSSEETVNLYAIGSVPATTTIVNLIPGGNTLSARVVYGNSVNPYFVTDLTTLALYLDGSAVSLEETASFGIVNSGTPDTIKAVITSSTGQSFSAGVISFGQSSSDLTDSFSDLLPSTATWSAGIYAAQAFYAGVSVGAQSVVWDASRGPSSLLSEIKPTFVNTLDANYSASRTANELRVRTSTSTLTLGAQIYSASDVTLNVSNVEIKAVVEENALHSTSAITVTGASGRLVQDGNAVTAYARTDNTGKASFTITSTTGRKDDSIAVTLYARTSTGAWLAMSGDVDVVWEDASFTSSQFSAKPANYVSGANPTVTFKVADQWGKALNAVNGQALTVYGVASFGGVENAKSYSSTVVVANGEAKFTFANFAPAGGLAQLKATLFQGALNNAASIASTVVNVYNTAATDKVAVVDSFDVAVTYDDYVTGDTSDPAVAAKVADARLSASADGKAITGNVLNASGVGQPGVAVTVAAKDVLFYADGVYSLDTITTNANEFGAFTVYAIAHTVYAKGTTVSITADGKTATTKLVTYLPGSIADENLKFSWTLPAQVVKNTTYAVVLSLTDKWGNPIATTNPSVNAVAVQGLGSVEINSSASAISRNFDAKGQATVFLRSVKDIAGPGSITATLASTFSYTTAEGAAATSSTIGAFNVSDTKATAWDETLWSNTLTSNIEVLDSAPASAGKVNVGSFNGKLVVYAANLNGARISWKVGGNWGSAVATSNYSIFNRPTPRAGVTVSVDIYVNGVKTLTKSVVTR